MTAAPRPGPVKAAVFAAASILLGLALAEGALQAWFTARRIPYEAVCADTAPAYEVPGTCYVQYDNFPPMTFNSFLGYVPARHAAGRGFRTNNQRLRYAEDFPAAKPAGERRVFVTGGSMAWGAGVGQEDLYATRIERALNAPGVPRVRVVAAGVGAYVSANERTYALDHLLGLAPDLLVMFSGWNDAYRGYQGKRGLDDNDYLGAGRVLPGRVPQYVRDGDAPEPDPAPDETAYRIKLAYLWDRTGWALRRPAAARTVAARLVPPDEVVDGLLANVLAVRDAARRRGAGFCFYLQPTLYATRKALAPYERRVLDTDGAIFLRYPAYNREVYARFRRRLPEAARREGFGYADADEAIAGEREAVFVDHVHLSDRGHRLIAAHLGPLIRARLARRGAP